MTDNIYALAVIGVASVVTIAIRFAPFIIFRKEPPAAILYLGDVLPYAIMGMLVIYCLKGVSFTGGSHGIPELASAFHTCGNSLLHAYDTVCFLGGTI